MKASAVGAQVGRDGKGPSVEVQVSFPENFDEAVKAWGPEVLWTKARQSIVIDLQALVRRLLGKGKPQAEIQTLVNAWQPAVAGEVIRKTAFERASEDLIRCSPAEKKALLERIQKELQAKAAA